MNKNKYNHISLSQSKRYTLNINKFGGVDLSSQRFNVDSSRSIDAKNFYLKDGVIQVREGFEELTEAKGNKYTPLDFKTNLQKTTPAVLKTNGTNFNGIWRFRAEDNEYHLVAHIGRLLYEIKDFGNKNVHFEPISNDSRTISATDGTTTEVVSLLYEFEDFRSFAFVGDNKLWFLGGNQYMVIRFKNCVNKLSPVEDNDITFIPKTTIGITYTNSQVTGRSSLDNPNMLTMFRRNTLISGTGKQEDSLTETKYFEYVLDSSLLTKNNQLINDQPTDEAKKAFSKIHIILRERGEI